MSSPNKRTVQRRDDGDYEVVKPHAERASAVTRTQAKGVDRAREILRNDGGGELAIRGNDGKIRAQDTIAPATTLALVAADPALFPASGTVPEVAHLFGACVDSALAEFGALLAGACRPTCSHTRSSESRLGRRGLRRTGNDSCLYDLDPWSAAQITEQSVRTIRRRLSDGSLPRPTSLVRDTSRSTRKPRGAGPTHSQRQARD